MTRLPTVTLDTTIAELYKRASPQNADKHIGQVLCGVNSAIQLSPHFPRNAKFLYQDSPFNTLPKDELADDNHELQRSLAMKYLSLIPQRDAFISGNTAVVLFNVNQTPAQIQHDMDEALRTIDVLDPSQRPRLVFCAGPADIPLTAHKVDMLAYKLAIDSLKDYPTTCPLETHWFLNSKAGLARSGLPTPKCDILELDGFAAVAEACCDTCRAGDALYIAPACRGERATWLDAATERVLATLRARPLPFVLKNQQTFGGAGTYVVRDEAARKALVADMSGGLLRKLFSQVTPDNHHLAPASILLSDMVADPIGDYGLTFFVTDTGGVLFLAASEQMTDGANAWVGSTISYARQHELQQKFEAVMYDIAAWLHGHGYYGPVGADILETRVDQDVASLDPRAGLHVVDLNVRTSGSICLPLLRGHFTSRGLMCASSFGITVDASRDRFIQRWQSEVESGAMCILSWYEDRDASSSIADVAVGAKDESSLRDVIQKIKATSAEVTF